MKTLASVANDYKVGLTGKFIARGDYYSVLPKLNSKLMQIQLYCKRYGKVVVVYIDQNVPAFFYGFIYQLGLSVKIVQDDSVPNSSPNVFAEDIKKYLEDTCDVTLIVRQKEDEIEFEGDFIDFIYTKKSSKEPFLTEDPRTPVKEYVKKMPVDSDPYAVFYHEDLFERVPYDRWNEVVDQMPDIRDPTSREFL